MAVISFGKDMPVCLLMTITLVVISFTMSLHPVDCAMTAEQSTLKILSAKFVLILTAVTQADDVILESIKKPLFAANDKFKELYRISGILYGMDAHENIPSPYETEVLEMDRSFSRLTPLESLDPFLAQVLDSIQANWIKPLNKWNFKKAALEEHFYADMYNQAAKAALEDCKRHIEATTDAIIKFESALLRYRIQWEQSHVRPKQPYRKPVLDAMEQVNSAIKYHLIDDWYEAEDATAIISSSSTGQSYFWWQVSGFIAALVIIVVMVGLALWFILYEKRGLARPSKHRASPRTTSSKTDSSP